MHAAEDARSKLWTKRITEEQRQHIKANAYYNRATAVTAEDIERFKKGDLVEEHFLVCAKTAYLHLDTNQFMHGFRVFLPISLLVGWMAVFSTIDFYTTQVWFVFSRPYKRDIIADVSLFCIPPCP